MAIQEYDRYLGVIIDDLKEKEIWETTEIILTSTHGYDAQTPSPNHETWIMATQKVLFKGSHLDIMPSVLDLFGLETPENLAGKSLFRL